MPPCEDGISLNFRCALKPLPMLSLLKYVTPYAVIFEICTKSYNHRIK